MNYWKLLERALRPLVGVANWIAQTVLNLYWWAGNQSAGWELAHGYYVEYRSMDEFIESLETKSQDAFGFWDNDEDAAYDEF